MRVQSLVKNDLFFESKTFQILENQRKTRGTFGVVVKLIDMGIKGIANTSEAKNKLQLTG